MELLQRRTGIHAELLAEDPPSPVERQQGVSLPARPIQGEHEQGPEPLPKREPGDQRLQLAHHLEVATDLQVGIQSEPERTQAEFLQPSDLGLGEGDVGQVLERGPLEQRERLAKVLSPGQPVPGGERRPRPVEEGVESLQVELAVFDPQ